MSKPAPTLLPSPTSQVMTHPAVIDPELALELRLRWLEAIVLGVKQDAKAKAREVEHLRHGETLVRLVEDLQRRLNAIVEGNEGLKKFMDHSHDQYLTPAFALSGILPEPPTFITEMEPDIRAADRDMREIEILEKKGITEAGRLTDYEVLQPRLSKLLDAHHEDLELATALEKRIASLVDRHATYVDTLSELFVTWDDTVTEAEHKVMIIERDREENRRLGLEEEEEEEEEEE
ncbi:hypothetical protein BDQ17DRAFT_1389735 [Cyathus striatus]|nr:hypothetical protein BDQ17DRAFT_1389735 [Cyathus striatus]